MRELGTADFTDLRRLWRGEDRKDSTLVLRLGGRGSTVFVSMDSLETLLAPIRHSPRLVEAVDLLQEQVQRERERWVTFYRDMTPEEKIEFIDGEVILHSPARKGHLDSTKLLLKLLHTFVSLRELGSVMSEKCLCVFPRNDYEPDIVFFGSEKADTLSSETLKFPIPDFVVEVLSESTRQVRGLCGAWRARVLDR
jgi:hypothetical protein